MARKLRTRYIEVSAKENILVSDVFLNMVTIACANNPEKYNPKQTAAQWNINNQAAAASPSFLDSISSWFKEKFNIK